MDIKTLIAVATGKIPHNYRSGICPDELQPDSRDPDCPACKILIEAEHDKIGRPAAYIEDMERELRAAEIRLHDVAAHCANVEAELAEIKPAKPATAQVQLNDSEMEMIARAHGTGGWQTLDDMAIFARAIEAAVLRANGFDIQPAKPVVEMGMREEFEKWAAENGLLVDRWDHAPDSYIWFNTSLGWKAWQAAQHATRDDSARLDFLDQNLAMFPIQMGWNVGVAPGGNVSITTVIGGQNNIRESIDFAMQSMKGAK